VVGVSGVSEMVGGISRTRRLTGIVTVTTTTVDGTLKDKVKDVAVTVVVKVEAVRVLQGVTGGRMTGAEQVSACVMTIVAMIIVEMVTDQESVVLVTMVLLMSVITDLHRKMVKEIAAGVAIVTIIVNVTTVAEIEIVIVIVIVITAEIVIMIVTLTVPANETIEIMVTSAPGMTVLIISTGDDICNSCVYNNFNLLTF
jgi:hypothetical protein